MDKHTQESPPWSYKLLPDPPNVLITVKLHLARNGEHPQAITDRIAGEIGEKILDRRSVHEYIYETDWELTN